MEALSACISISIKRRMIFGNSSNADCLLSVRAAQLQQDSIQSAGEGLTTWQQVLSSR